MSKYYITVDTHTPGNRKETFINDSISRYAGMLVEGDDPVKVIREEVDNLIKIANEKFRSRIVNPSSHHKYQLIESIYIDFGNYSSTVRMHLVTSEADLSIIEKGGEE